MERPRTHRWRIGLAALFLLAGCDAVVDMHREAADGLHPPATLLYQTAAPVMTYRLIAAFPHDEDAFTQGLAVDRDTLFEGTGLHGASSLRRVGLATGTVQHQVDLPRSLFGEGIAIVEDRIVQLTWQEGIAFVYDRATFAVLDTFFYDHKGWGLTYDGERLIVSDGTSTLRFRDSETFELVDQVTVRDGGTPVRRLNELEYIEGEVWANVWKTDRIARIDPATGEVTAWIDLSGLLTPQEEAGLGSEAVLNGIAYDAARDRLFVTGKLWPWVFEIDVVAAPRRRTGEDRGPV